MPTPPATSRVTLAIEGMHCASCVATIEGALSGVTGVTAASVNLATARAQVVGRGLNARRLIDAVLRSGYDAKPAGEEEPGQAGSTFSPRAFASAGAANAYYAVVGFIMTLRLSASF